jgi:hypothetical protein
MESLGDKVSNFAGGVRAMWEGKGRKSEKTAAKKASPVAQVQASEWETARRKFDDVEQACRSLRLQLKEGPAYNLIGEVSAELQKIRVVIEEDSNKRSSVSMLLSDYLVPTEQALRLYERLLKRNVASAQPVLQEMSEKTLPLMHTRIVALFDQIHVGDIARLSTIASAFELARNLEVNVEAEAEAEARL